MSSAEKKIAETKSRENSGRCRGLEEGERRRRRERGRVLVEMDLREYFDEGERKGRGRGVCV
jgi:hypothetical protein